jgi:2-keto-3-deoxy-L-fuconate dehydrogenase
MSRLKNKIALVTAAGQGIGRASAELFATEGARVIAVDINPAALSTLSGMETRQVDLTNGAAIETLSREVTFCSTAPDSFTRGHCSRPRMRISISPSI